MANSDHHPLRIRRKEIDLTMQELAARVGCKQSFISQIESGDRQPSLGMALKLSRETGLPVEAFVKTEAAQ